MKKIFASMEWLGGAAALLLLWLVFADWKEWASPMLLPSFSGVASKLSNLMVSGAILPDFKATAYRWAMGFTLGSGSGALAGLFLGAYPRIYRIFELPIEFVRALPVTAIFPLFLLVFGIGDGSKIAMTFTPTFLLMLIHAAYGVAHASKGRLEMAHVFGANRWQSFSRVTFFDALPQIFIGLRLAVSISLIVVVVSEMFIGTEFGLGQRVFDSYLTNQVVTLYALLLILGIMGYLLNKLVIWIEHRFIFWAKGT